MKLTKKQAKELTSILDSLRRGQSYLMASDILVCRRASVATTTLHFTNPAGECCFSVDKEIGSELALLHTGIRRLRDFLDATQTKSQE